MANTDIFKISNEFQIHRQKPLNSETHKDNISKLSSENKLGYPVLKQNLVAYWSVPVRSNSHLTSFTISLFF